MKYFTGEELIRSSTADSLDICNVPKTQEVWDNLNALVNNILDPAREALGAPIYINSGYRTPELNIAVGGTKGSQHVKGMAADIRAGDMKKLLTILKTLDFDQLGVYKRFYHVSYDPLKSRQRHEIFYVK